MIARQSGSPAVSLAGGRDKHERAGNGYLAESYEPTVLPRRARALRIAWMSSILGQVPNE